MEASVAALGKDGSDLVAPRVTGIKSRCLRSELATCKVGQHFIVESGDKLPLVEDRRVEKGLTDLVESKLGEASIGLVEGIWADPAPERHEIPAPLVGKSENVVRSWL